MSSLCVVALALVTPIFAADASGQHDLVIQVKAVFQAKCVECHGPQVRKPRGKFGYILDLEELAVDPKKVLPFEPEDSKLWQLVRDEEMPPEEAKAGPLTEEQKQIIHDWIAAGAPSTPIAPAAPLPSSKSSETAPAPFTAKHFLRFLGKFHVMMIHFPIALLLAAAAGEAWSVWRRVGQPAPTVRFCVLLGALSAVVSAALGWLHAASGYGLDSPVILDWHRRFGTATAVGSAILAVLSEFDSRRGVRSWWFRLLLLLVALLVAVAGHFGGLLAYGDDFFKW